MQIFSPNASVALRKSPRGRVRPWNGSTGSCTTGRRPRMNVFGQLEIQWPPRQSDQAERAPYSSQARPRLARNIGWAAPPRYRDGRRQSRPQAWSNKRATPKVSAPERSLANRRTSVLCRSCASFMATRRRTHQDPSPNCAKPNAAGFMMLSRVLDLPDLYVCMGISAGWLTAKLHR
jgi:hypothetical protein